MSAVNIVVANSAEEAFQKFDLYDRSGFSVKCYGVVDNVSIDIRAINLGDGEERWSNLIQNQYVIVAIKSSAPIKDTDKND